MWMILVFFGAALMTRVVIDVWVYKKQNDEHEKVIEMLNNLD